MQRGEGIEVLTADETIIQRHIRKAPVNENTKTYEVIFSDCAPTEEIIAAMLESKGAVSYSGLEVLFQPSPKKYQVKIRFNTL